jgi:hypothetical protein
MISGGKSVLSSMRPALQPPHMQSTRRNKRDNRSWQVAQASQSGGHPGGSIRREAFRVKSRRAGPRSSPTAPSWVESGAAIEARALIEAAPAIPPPSLPPRRRHSRCIPVAVKSIFVPSAPGSRRAPIASAVGWRVVARVTASYQLHSRSSASGVGARRRSEGNG